MIGIRNTVLAALMAAATAVPAVAQELKIGYVSNERVVNESNQAKAAAARLQAEFGKREKDLRESDQKLRQQFERFEKEAPTLSDAEKIRRQRELGEQDRDLQRKRREYQEDLTQRKNDELAALVERANRVIKHLYESEKYDLIIQDAIHASPRIDITKKVIDALNAQK